MNYRKLDSLADKGFVILRDYAGPPIPAEEWERLEYVDWKSGGDTNFARLASAMGEMEGAGFWDTASPTRTASGPPTARSRRPSASTWRRSGRGMGAFG